MNIQNLIIDKLFSDLKKAHEIVKSCESCLNEHDYEQAMVRLQMLGVNFTDFECAVISSAKPEGEQS